MQLDLKSILRRVGKISGPLRDKVPDLTNTERLALQRLDALAEDLRAGLMDADGEES